MRFHSSRFALSLLAAVFALMALAAACSSTDPEPTPTSVPTAAPTTAPPPTAAPQPTAQPTAAEASSASMETEPGGATFTLGAGSMARYLVNEQLARMNSPIDAIGETDQVEGGIVFAADASVDSAKSKITVDMASLKSDSDRRDGYVRSNTLETNKYPTAEIVVKSTPGLPWPLPSSGEVSFQIVGDVTIHGVTKELTWEATAQAGEGGSVTGTAKINFTFDTFEMDIPSVFVVVSVQDNIRLEIDFSGTVSGG